MRHQKMTERIHLRTELDIDPEADSKTNGPHRNWLGTKEPSRKMDKLQMQELSEKKKEVKS